MEILKEVQIKANLIEGIGKKTNKPYKAVQLIFEEDGKQDIKVLYFPDNEKLRLRLGLIEDK